MADSHNHTDDSTDSGTDNHSLYDIMTCHNCEIELNPYTHGREVKYCPFCSNELVGYTDMGVNLSDEE